jgi:NTE family protein
MGKMALVLGGGAPNFTLMTGVLLAFDEAGVKFDVISASGGGGAVALLYLAPKGMERHDALKHSVNLGVSDAIYRFLPMNYKVFQKGGKVADLFRKALSKFPGYGKVMNQAGMSPKQKLASDLLQAWWALITPSTVNLFSPGLCANTPWIDGLVDFDKLKNAREELYLNAYCITDHKMAIFNKQEIDGKRFGATLSYPFLYPPTEIDGKLYIEGASQDAFNFQGLLEYDKEIATVVVLDSFSNERYMQAPRNLWQAWGQSVITPLIALARSNMLMFESYLKNWNRKHPERHIKLIKVHFDVPATWLPEALDWSTSNLERNFKLGYETGKEVVAAYGPTLQRKSAAVSVEEVHIVHD